MQTDPGDRYRAALRVDPPDFVDRVDTPWDNVPDYADYNAAAYRQIDRDVERLKKAAADGRPASRGILILGESGSGKTHLLMRVARNLSKKNHILFVRRPNDEESVAQHVWANIVSSLSREVIGSAEARSQIDDLLSHVFSAVLIHECEKRRREAPTSHGRYPWVEKLKKDPYHLFDLLGNGLKRADMLRRIRRMTLQYCRRVHPQVDQNIVHALVSYCMVSQLDRKRALLNWLSGQELDEHEARAVGLPVSSTPMDETTSNASYQQRREEFALRAIQTLGVLSTHYQPLILAFDQLEGLRNEERLTQRWGDVLREIFTMTPNMLVVTCIFPSLWTDWFEPHLDKSAAERIAQHRVELERFRPEQGLRLLETQLAPARQTHRLPDSIYPFTLSDVARMCESATSPRLFIQAARKEFENWIDADLVVDQALGLDNGNSVLRQKSLDDELRATLEKFELEQRANYENELFTGEDFMGRIRRLLKVVLMEQPIEFDEAKWSHYVMPPNVVLRSRAHGDQVCIACLNDRGTALTARMRNLVSAFREREQFRDAVMLRDCRCSKLGGKASGYQAELQSLKGEDLSVTADEFILLNALYDALVAVEEQNVSVDGRIATTRDFRQFVKHSGVARRSQLFRTLSRVAVCIEQAIGLPAGVQASVGPDDLAADDVEQFGVSGPFNAELSGTWQDQENMGDATGQSGNVSLGAPIAVLEAVVVDKVDGSSAAKQTVLQRVSCSHIAPVDKVSPAQVLIGDTDLDSAHVGVVGRLRDSGQVLGISLTKPQCIVLLGYMGSGKSYGLGVLMENALVRTSNVVSCTRPMTVVAFNYRRNSSARFEFHGFAQPNGNPTEVTELSEQYQANPLGIEAVSVFGYEPELKRRRDDYGGLPTFALKFRPDELGAEHWQILMKPPQPQSEYMDIIRDVIQDLYYQDRLSLANLSKAITTDERFSNGQRRQAISRLSFAERWLSDDRDYEWKDVLKEGTLNVFDLRMQTLTSDEALKLCLVVTDLARRTRNGVNKLIVFDEAHEYVDSKELIDELENAITQMRHDGMSFVLASQFPERIPERVFKYMTTRFIFKLPSAKAIECLKAAAPNLKTLQADQVANLGLEKGVCLVQTDDDTTDNSLRIPQLLQIRPRLSQHGGATVRHV